MELLFLIQKQTIYARYAGGHPRIVCFPALVPAVGDFLIQGYDRRHLQKQRERSSIIVL